MAHAYGLVFVHVIFSTKHREKILTEQLHSEFARYITVIIADHHGRLVAEGGMSDHVHLLIDLGRESSVSQILRAIKSRSSLWLQRKLDRSFGWQSGYAVFSVSATHLKQVERYIANQARHHARRSFEVEFEEMLKAAGVPFNSDALWRKDEEPKAEEAEDSVADSG